MPCLRNSLLLSCCIAAAVVPMPCQAADDAPTPAARPAGQAAATAAPPQPAPAEGAERDETFRRLVSKVKLSGQFTMDGEPGGKPQQEEYVITGATKLGKGDTWVLTSRIRYGTVDLTVPVPVQVKWAGDTPVITLDRVGIPGLGTFSARVVLDGGRYAGTWSHDAVGGHLFGRITPVADAAGPQPAGTDAAPPPQAPHSPPAGR